MYHGNTLRFVLAKEPGRQTAMEEISTSLSFCPWRCAMTSNIIKSHWISRTSTDLRTTNTAKASTTTWDFVTFTNSRSSLLQTAKFVCFHHKAAIRKAISTQPFLLSSFHQICNYGALATRRNGENLRQLPFSWSNLKLILGRFWKLAQGRLELSNRQAGSRSGRKRNERWWNAHIHTAQFTRIYVYIGIYKYCITRDMYYKNATGMKLNHQTTNLNWCPSTQQNDSISGNKLQMEMLSDHFWAEPDWWESNRKWKSTGQQNAFVYLYHVEILRFNMRPWSIDQANQAVMRPRNRCLLFVLCYQLLGSNAYMTLYDDIFYHNHFTTSQNQYFQISRELSQAKHL